MPTNWSNATTTAEPAIYKASDVAAIGEAIIRLSGAEGNDELISAMRTLGIAICKAIERRIEASEGGASEIRYREHTVTIGGRAKVKASCEDKP